MIILRPDDNNFRQLFIFAFRLVFHDTTVTTRVGSDGNTRTVAATVAGNTRTVAATEWLYGPGGVPVTKYMLESHRLKVLCWLCYRYCILASMYTNIHTSCAMFAETAKTQGIAA